MECFSARNVVFEISIFDLASQVQFKTNYFTEICSGSEAGSYLRLIDFCITQLNA